MELVEIGKRITEEEIRELEIKIKLEFPAEYKFFLMENNGGMPKDMVGFKFIERNVATQETWEQGSDIHYFYNVDEVMDAYENLVCEGSITKEHLPIACDSFGNDIVLCLTSNKNYGNVCFVNHELENVENTFGNISYIADSFNGFLELLEVIDLG